MGLKGESTENFHRRLVNVYERARKLMAITERMKKINLSIRPCSGCPAATVNEDKVKLMLSIPMVKICKNLQMSHGSACSIVQSHGYSKSSVSKMEADF